MKVAAIQMCSGTRTADNLRAARALLEEAARADAELAVLPEYFSIMGQNDRDKLAEQRDSSNLALILAAIQNKDTIATTIQGTLDSTAGTWSGTGTGSLS